MGFWTNSRSSGTFSDIGFFNHLNNFKLLTLHYIYEAMEWLLLPLLKTFLGIVVLLCTQNVYIGPAEVSHPKGIIFQSNDYMMKCITLSSSLSC